MKIYDSIYNSLDPDTIAVVVNHCQGSIHSMHAQMVESQKQDGAYDWGLFAIINATAEAFNTTSPDTSP